MVLAGTPTPQAGAGSGAPAEPNAGDSGQFLLKLLPGRPAPERERSSWDNLRAPLGWSGYRHKRPDSARLGPPPRGSAPPPAAACAPLLLFAPRAPLRSFPFPHSMRFADGRGVGQGSRGEKGRGVKGGLRGAWSAAGWGEGDGRSVPGAERTNLLVALIAGSEGAVHPLQVQAEVRDAVQPHHPPGRNVLHARGRHGSARGSPPAVRAAAAATAPGRATTPGPAPLPGPPQAPPLGRHPRLQSFGPWNPTPFCALGSALGPPANEVGGEVKSSRKAPKICSLIAVSKSPGSSLIAVKPRI